MSVLTLFCLLLRVPSIQQIENVSLIGSPSVGWVRGPPEKKSVNPAQGFNSFFFLPGSLVAAECTANGTNGFLYVPLPCGINVFVSLKMGVYVSGYSFGLGLKGSQREDL